jgi:hypothetical protein
MGGIRYHDIGVPSVITEFEICSIPSVEAFFRISFVPPQTTTSSLVNLSIYLFAVFVISSNPVPGFT